MDSGACTGSPRDAARMRALRLEMLADSPLAFLETLAQAAARSHADYRRRIVQASPGGQLAQFVADPRAGPADRARRRHGAARGPGRDGRLRRLHHPGAARAACWPSSSTRWPSGRWRTGRDELMLEVVVGNDRAVRAYERLGFEDTGVRVPHPVVPGCRSCRCAAGPDGPA